MALYTAYISDITVKSDEGPFSAFSNAHTSYFIEGDCSYKSVIHYVYAKRQKMKYFQDMVRESPSPHQAIDLAMRRQNQWIPDWETKHIQFMQEAIMFKVKQSEEITKLLTKTKGHPLIVFEKSLQDTDRPNLVGEMLMAIRDKKIDQYIA